MGRIVVGAKDDFGVGAAVFGDAVGLVVSKRVFACACACSARAAVPEELMLVGGKVSLMEEESLWDEVGLWLGALLSCRDGAEEGAGPVG